MSAAKTRAAHKRPDFIDPTIEAQTVKALRESIAALNEDDDLLADTIEGETGFYEVIDRLMDRILEAEVMVEGVDAVVARLTARKQRAETNAKRDRALIEQAMTIAELDTMTRPAATFTLARRAPSLVITEESEIPPRFWKAGEPKLDKKALTDALRDRAAAWAAASQRTGDERTQAIAALAVTHPDIPGATLSNGAPSLTIRIK
jgi:hypothetical protein